MKKKSVIIVTIGVALFGAMALTLASNKKEIDSRKEERATDDRIAVTVALTQIRETSRQWEWVGMTEPRKEVVVASESVGKIVQVNFSVSDYVSKGAILAKVDDTYKRLALENAELNYKKYKEDYERYRILRKADAVSENQLRDMKTGFENAAIQFENAKKQWEDTQILAPFSGVITSKNTEVGAYVNPGTSIATMADVAQLKISLSVSESVVYQLGKGQEVSVSTQVYPGVTFRGNIASISPQGSNAHTFPVEILMTNSSKNPLKAGTYVKVSLKMEETGSALMIPRDAIVNSMKDPSVYVVKGETVELVRINTGREDNAYLEVISGINEGDRVVTNGQINLMNGATISIIN
ncbi:MexH family multidrug efflux RND transporter periplasmic adaptor subunit [Alphaproteobacteria bacterium]|nr:MexH family multidrug efflux RND transporter periplasmic adaptor subunit [Alphaproteobacteria bacterium]